MDEGKEIRKENGKQLKEKIIRTRDEEKKLDELRLVK